MSILCYLAKGTFQIYLRFLTLNNEINLHYLDGLNVIKRSLKSREFSLAGVRQMQWKRQIEQNSNRGCHRFQVKEGVEVGALCMDQRVFGNQVWPADNSQQGNGDLSQSYNLKELYQGNNRNDFGIKFLFRAPRKECCPAEVLILGWRGHVGLLIIQEL